MKPNAKFISHREAYEERIYRRFNYGGISIKAVPAYNENHDKSECVGYVITIDGIKIYASGDTSKTEYMAKMSELGLDYAMFCGDGFYNMGPEEAAECVELVGAKNNILIHTVPDAKALFDPAKAEAWTAPNKLIIDAGQEIELESDANTAQKRRVRKTLSQRRTAKATPSAVGRLRQAIRPPPTPPPIFLMPPTARRCMLFG